MKTFSSFIEHRVHALLHPRARMKRHIVPMRRDWLLLLAISVGIFLMLALLGARAFFAVDEAGLFYNADARAVPLSIDQERLADLLFELELRNENFERLKTAGMEFPLP